MNDRPATTTEAAANMAAQKEAEDNKVPWEDFEMSDSETEAKKQEFPLIAEGLYEVICTGMEMVLGKKYMSDEDQKQFEWTFELAENVSAPGTPFLDTKGNNLERLVFPVWSQLYQTKISKGQAQLTRAIMTSLLGIPVDAGIPGKVHPDMFIGKKCRVFVEVGFKMDNVTKKNMFKKFSVCPGVAPQVEPAQPVQPEATPEPTPTEPTEAPSEVTPEPPQA